MATATIQLAGGDRDCSSAVADCYEAVGVLPRGTYMWTGNERDVLCSHGFVAVGLASPKPGDVLWREGHTEMILMDGRQGGPRHGDYAGGLDGRKGDQDGTEVAASAYRASSWTRCYRYVGSRSVNGIPAPIAAALAMQHLIDHDAHGYSQPHRYGDGTTETVRITWSEPKMIKCDTFKVTPVTEYNIRTRMSMDDDAVIGQLRPGQRVKCDGIVLDGGRTWLHYTYKGKDRYLKYTDALVVA